MLLAILLIAGVADWAPARWASSDPRTLELLAGTPINCLLLEPAHWSPAFSEEAGRRSIATLGVVRPGQETAALAEKAKTARLAGLVLEGDFPPALLSTLADSKVLVIELPSRTRMKFDAPITGTTQAVWPGINPQEDGAAKAAPSGAPWIDTNSGFLRFVRAMARGPVWIGYRPPPRTVVPLARYFQAIGDAALAGARWIVSLDQDLERRLLARDEAALADWRRIAAHLGYFDNKDWAAFGPYGHMALVQDVESGALFSGGILDMIGVKHTPVRPVPIRRLSDQEMKSVQMAVDVDPTLLSPDQKDTLRRFTRAGGTLLTGPPGWRFPRQREDQITLDKEDVEKIDQIWKEVNSLTGRRNLGARLFHVASMLSDLRATADGKRLLLHLVNYSDFPVEGVTVHFLGRFTKATVYEPGVAPRSTAPYEIEDGVGVEIDKVGVYATLVLE